MGDEDIHRLGMHATRCGVRPVWYTNDKGVGSQCLRRFPSSGQGPYLSVKKQNVYVPFKYSDNSGVRIWERGILSQLGLTGPPARENKKQSSAQESTH